MTSDAAPPFRLSSLGLSVYLPTFLFAVGQGAIIPIIPQFATNVGATIALAALVVGLRGIGTMVFDVPSGILIGRFGERTAMLVGTALLVVVALGASFAQTPVQVAALVFVMGGAWSIWGLARLTYVSDQAPVESRGRALSLVGGTSRAGNFVGPLIGGLCGEWLGLGSVFWLQAAFAVSASAIMFVLIREADGAAAVHHDSIYQRFTGVLVENRHVFLTAGMATVCLQVLRTSRQAVLPLWGQQNGMSPSEIGLIFGISSAVDMLLFYPVGMVMDRWGRKWVAAPSLIVLGLSLMLIPLADTFTSLMLVGLVAGVGNGLGAGIVMTLGADFSPPSSRGEFLGVWRLIGDIGTAGGPVVLSVLTGVLSLGAASVATGGIGFVGAAIVVLFVAEPLKQKQARPSPPPG